MRAASVGGMLTLAGLAGCSSDNSRFNDYGYDNGFSYSATGSLRSDNGYSAYSRNGYSSSYGNSYSQVSRNELPPLGAPSNFASFENGNGNGSSNGGRQRVADATTFDGPDAYTGSYGPRGRKAYEGRWNGYEDYNAGSYRERPEPYNGNGYRRPDDEPYNGNGYRRSRGAAYDGKRVTVAPGDTLYTIGQRYGVSTEALMDANGLKDGLIHPGQELVIPADEGWRDRTDSSSDGGDYYAASEGRRNSGGRSEDADGCPNCYKVQPGDTLFTIARRYGLGPAHIAHYNKIQVNAPLRPGQVLMIPSPEDEPSRVANSQYDTRDGPRRPMRFAAAKPGNGGAETTHHSGQRAPNGSSNGGEEAPLVNSNEKNGEGRETGQDAKLAAKPAEKLATATDGADGKDCEDLLANPMPRAGDNFRQPVDGLIISKFGPKEDGTYNDGINIAVPKGTVVKAAENGVVTYVGTEISGFGNLILIQHAGNFVTAYAHNDEVMVKRCDVVKRGQAIAKAGATGSVSKPQLHFEVRQDSKPVDPEKFFTTTAQAQQ